MAPRDRDVSLAIRWCGASVVWAAIVGATAVCAGLAAGAIALVGFGADSITDGLASAVLVWRFGRERAGRVNIELIERRAAIAVGAILIAIGMYVSVSAVVALANRSTPDRSTVGIALTAASVLVLPVLAHPKLRLAGTLESSALRGDGILSLAPSGNAISSDDADCERSRSGNAALPRFALPGLSPAPPDWVLGGQSGSRSQVHVVIAPHARWRLVQALANSRSPIEPSVGAEACGSGRGRSRWREHAGVSWV